MRIFVCCKIVPDEQTIHVNKHGELDLENAAWKVSLYDLNALEAARQMASEIPGSKITAISVGNSSQLGGTKSRKDILSRGPEDLSIVVNDQYNFSNSLETAKALAEAVKGTGEFDLILCGTGSSDVYSQAVGIQLGTILGIPAINNISDIRVEDERLILERDLEEETETMEIELPAVISVSSDINTPPYLNIRALMAAGRKPVAEIYADLSEKVSVEQIEEKAPIAKERSRILVEGEDDEAVDALYDFIKNRVVS